MASRLRRLAKRSLLMGRCNCLASFRKTDIARPVGGSESRLGCWVGHCIGLAGWLGIIAILDAATCNIVPVASCDPVGP